MTAQQASSRITFQQGLLESQESSKLDIGFLKDCVNWVPEPNGALRVRAGWSKGSETGAPATRRNRGIGLITRFNNPTIVQTSAPSVTVSGTAGSGGPFLTSPAPSWPVPTTAGNLLLLVCTAGWACTSMSSQTFTVAGWTSAVNVGDTTGTAGARTQIFYIANASVQTGTQTFTNGVSATGQSFSYRSAWWLVELAGVLSTPLDITASNTAAAATSVAVTSGATTQASEFVLAVDSIGKLTTAPTLSTATAGWTTQLTSTAQANAGGGPVIGHSAAIYVGTRNTTGTQNITSTSTATADHTLALVTLRGWNTAASPGDSVPSYLAANDNTTTFDIYRQSDLIAGTYENIDPAIGASTGGTVAFTRGFGAAWYTHKSFLGIRRYDGVTASTVATSPAGARCIATNHSRMWAGGGTAFPSRVNFTQVLEPLTWTGTGTGYFDFAADDGEPVEDIAPFGGGLVVGKATTLHFLSGSSTDTFSPLQLDGGGAAPGRSILATPYGCVIAGLEQVWSFDGVQVRPLGRGIQHSYGLTDVDFVTTSYIDGFIYIAVPTKGKVFVFDLNAGTWHVEQVSDGGNETPAVLYNYGDTQLYGPLAGTVGSLLNYRTFPDPARTKDFDPLSEVFSAQTGDLPLAGTRRPITPRQLYMQLRQRGGDETESGLLVTPIFDGSAGDVCDVDSAEPGVRRIVVEGFPQTAGLGVNTLGIRIAQTVISGEASVTDVEDAYVDFLVEEARS